MIAHVAVKRRGGVRVLGSNPVGLMLYLFGPGKANEHTRQRVIAASTALGIIDGTRLDYRTQRGEIKELGGQFDSHRKAFGREFPNGHLWHCAISLPPADSTAERRLTDAQWAEVVREAVGRLGFEAEGKAPCRWIAVHHGRSVEGNEHVHLVASLLREDGMTASHFRDWVTLSKLCRDMEQRFGLQIVEGRNAGAGAGVGQPDVSRAQLERARREGKAEPDQARLARTVRAAVAVARSEAEFVGALRDLGILVRPRYAAGGRDEVVGYSVALPPKPRQPTIWFGGGRLHRELTLPRLRERRWPQDGQTQPSPIGHAETLAAWGGSGAGNVLPDKTYGSQTWQKAATVLAELRAELIAVPVDQPELWALAAREAAGVLSMWSLQIEINRPGTLAHVADVLAQSAQLAQARADDLAHPGHRRIPPRHRQKHPRFDLRAVAVVASTASPQATPNYGQIMFLRQLIRLLEIILESGRAQRRALHAIERADATQQRLVRLQQHWTNLYETPRLASGNSQGSPFRPWTLSQPGIEI
ncbi:hypothetical protein GCM10022221_81960 [Actinocorallia aurea]